jgi:hypothetical protein
MPSELDLFAIANHWMSATVSVVGCGTRPSSGIPQNRRWMIESVTSRHKPS